MNIKELLYIAGEQGKVVIMDDSGECKAVFLSYSEYQKMIGEKGAAVPETQDQTEKINRAIVQAQLAEDVAIEPVVTPPAPLIKPAERLDSLLSKRAEQLFKSMPANRNGRVPVDMRSEVMDPNFDYSSPVVTSDDEEIRPNFDDI